MGRKLLRVTCSGFWTTDDVRAYADAQRAALADMEGDGCPRTEILILIDSTRQGPQAQDVIVELKRAVSATEFHVKRVAVVVSSALLARQSERSGPEHDVFYDASSAERWLLGGNAEPARA